MNQDFEDLIMATYADLCIEWRMKVSSFHSNATEVNTKLTSLEEVIRAFKIGVPGLIDSPAPAETKSEPEAKVEKEETSAETVPDIPAPTIAEYEVREAPKPSDPVLQPRKASGDRGLETEDKPKVGSKDELEPAQA